MTFLRRFRARRLALAAPDIALIATLAAATAWLLAGLGPGQPWDGDAELYIMNALNILHGRPYAETPYVFNPAAPINPVSYPPGLPLLMAPVLAVFGIDYLALKRLLMLCLLGVLALVAGLGRRRLGPWRAVILVAALGFNPFVAGFGQVVFSEFPFMLAAFAGLACFDRADPGTGARPGPGWAVAAALCFGLAGAIRTVGIVLVPAVVAMAALRRRGLWSQALIAGAGGVVVAVGLGRLFPADVGTYLSSFDQWHDTPLADVLSDIADTALAYARALPAIAGGARSGIGLGAGVILCVLALAGLGRTLRRRVSVHEVFALLYGLLLLVYPVSDEPRRYALPLLPLVMLHAVQMLPARVLAAAAVALALVYAQDYWHAAPAFGPSVDAPEAMELYQAIAQAVPEDGLVITTWPTILALHAGRHAIAPDEDAETDDVLRLARDKGAGWLMLAAPPLRDDLRPLLPGLRPSLHQVFRNRLYTLYRLRS